MVYSVVVTDEAACDLDSILNYLVEQLHTPKAAVDLMTEYNEILDNLERYPYMFEESRISARRKSTYHKLLLGKYVGLYQVDETEKCVTIEMCIRDSHSEALRSHSPKRVPKGSGLKAAGPV